MCLPNHGLYHKNIINLLYFKSIVNIAELESHNYHFNRFILSNSRISL